MNIFLESYFVILIVVFFLATLYLVKRKGVDGRTERLFYNYYVKIGNPLTTIIIPFFLMLIIFNLYDISLGRYQGNLIPFLIVLVRGVIAAPIAEEIIFRGIFFGWFLTKSEEWHSNARYLIIVIGLLVQAAVFMLGHFEIFNPKRLINGFIFGLLFLVFKRNLLPSLVAHGAFNLYVIMLTL